MPTVSGSFSYYLLPSQHAHRVRLTTIGSDNITVYAGSPDNGPWAPHTVIEIVIVNGTRPVQIAGYPLLGVVNYVTGGLTTLNPGQIARLHLLSFDTNTNATEWDCEIYNVTSGQVLYIDDLLDVFVSGTPSVGSPLTWDDQISRWTPGTPPWEYPPMPLHTVHISNGTTRDVGSAFDHNTHQRVYTPYDYTFVVQPDSFFSSTDPWRLRNSSSPAAHGSTIIFSKRGTGNVIFSPGPGVTINTPDTLTISNQHGMATLIKANDNEWDLEGNVGT